MPDEDRDKVWRPYAVSSRKALRALGVDARNCFPGEPDHHGCEGSYAEHFCANLAALKAIIDHHLTHFDPAFVAAVFPLVYEDFTAKIEAMDHEAEAAPDV